MTPGCVLLGQNIWLVNPQTERLFTVQVKSLVFISKLVISLVDHTPSVMEHEANKLAKKPVRTGKRGIPPKLE